jgi:hypothetical protein
MGNDFQDQTSLVFGYEVFCSIIGPGVYERAQWTIENTEHHTPNLLLHQCVPNHGPMN